MRYGWFGEPGSVEDFLKGRGETVVTGKAGTADDDGTLEIDRAQLEAWMAKQGVGATTAAELLADVCTSVHRVIEALRSVLLLKGAHPLTA